MHQARPGGRGSVRRVVWGLGVVGSVTMLLLGCASRPRPTWAPDGRPDRTQTARTYSRLIFWATARALREAALDEQVH
jgi:hypothetical protein